MSTAETPAAASAPANVVIIGAGGAGIAAVKSLRKNSPSTSLVLISEETELPYYRLKLTRYLAGEIARDIIDKIELLQQHTEDFNQMLADCNYLADSAYKSLDTPQTAVLVAEVLILLPGPQKENLEKSQSLLNSITNEKERSV